MLWLCTFQTGLIIYVSLLLLAPKILSVPFDPQDNDFLSWAHPAAFHNWSNCWVCGAPPSSSWRLLWWTSPLPEKDFLQVCKYLPQQSYVMPLLHLMTSTNPKLDWCNTLYFNYGHNVTFNFDYTLSRFNDYFATHKANRSGSNGFLPDVYQIWDEVMWLTPEKGHLISINGNPLQYSCLENPMDGGAWWAAAYGVAQSWTRLKWLSSSIWSILIVRQTFH